jgi:hypothetical protein
VGNIKKRKSKSRVGPDFCQTRPAPEIGRVFF